MTDAIPVKNFIIILLVALAVLAAYSGVQLITDSSGDFTEAMDGSTMIIDDVSDIDKLLGDRYLTELSVCIEDPSCIVDDISDDNSGTIEPNYVNPSVLIVAWCNDYCNGKYPGMYNDNCKEKCPGKVAEELERLRRT